MSVKAMLDRTMPLNLEERFWTATVLPALFAMPSLEHLDDLLELMRERAGASARRGEYNPSKVLFFTEYDAKKSNKKGCGRDISPSKSNLIPDVIAVELGEEIAIYAIEAKMIGCVNSVRWQRDQQLKFFLSDLESDLKREYGPIVAAPIHVALVPSPRVDAMRMQAVPAITWVEIREQTDLPDENYFVQCLDYALASYDSITTAEAKLHEGEYRGDELVHASTFAAPAAPPLFVRTGQNAQFELALRSGNWKTDHFQVNWTLKAAPHGWQPYLAFVERVTPFIE